MPADIEDIFIEINMRTIKCVLEGVITPKKKTSHIS